MIPRECEKCIHCRVCAYNNPKRKPHCGFYEESRPQGVWVKNPKSLWDLGNCSECGYLFVGIREANYCPKCGADMRKGEEKHGI